MLQAILADFRAWGEVHTITTLDRRLQHLRLPADDVLAISPNEYTRVFARLLARSDAALIIAPETDGVLARLSAKAQDAGVMLLGSSPTAVADAGDKWACYQRFRQAGLPTPFTQRTSFADAERVAREVGYPLVAKPVDGVGSEGVCLITNDHELAAALSILRRATQRDDLLLQKFINGIHASVSMLVTKNRVLPLSLNGQDMVIGCPCAYRGGIVPLSHPAAPHAIAIAQAAAKLLPGLQGYVGVDLVLAGKEAWLIEINPRLTVAYTGLRQVLQTNLAEAIWQACHQNALPEEITIVGRAAFTNAGQASSQAAAPEQPGQPTAEQPAG